MSFTSFLAGFLISPPWGLSSSPGRRLRSGVSRAILLTAVAAACSDPTEIVDPRALVAGHYSAQGQVGAFTLTAPGESGSETIDVIERGGWIDLRLDADGTAAGRLYLPPLGPEGEALDADLAGAWTVENGVVRLVQGADTFLRDTALVFEDGILTGERADGDVTISVRLLRT